VAIEEDVAVGECGPVDLGDVTRWGLLRLADGLEAEEREDNQTFDNVPAAFPCEHGR
jgi:hypothetical protein